MIIIALALEYADIVSAIEVFCYNNDLGTTFDRIKYKKVLCMAHCDYAAMNFAKIKVNKIPDAQYIEAKNWFNERVRNRQYSYTKLKA